MPKVERETNTEIVVRKRRKREVTPKEQVTALVSRFSLSWPVVVLALLFVVAVSSAGYFYYQYKYAASAAEAKEAEIKDLTETLGQFMVLPEGETPTLATVTDKTKLADQPFFQRAENGDQMLIYSASGRAILYRPSIEKIIDVTSVNVAPIATDEEAGTKPADLAVSPADIPENLTVALYNGSETVGATRPAETKVLDLLQKAKVVEKSNAERSDYQETLIIDVSGKAEAGLSVLAEGLSAKVEGLPEGEARPEADVLVIVGADGV